MSLTVTLLVDFAAKSQLIVGLPLSDIEMDTIVDVQTDQQDRDGFDVGH